TGDQRIFVGRESEMQALLMSLDAARSGEGRIVFLVGDGGMGKTRTLEEFVRRSHLPRDRVLWGRCPEQSGAPTYWPWIDAIRTYIDDAPDPIALRDELGAAAPDIAAIAPGVGTAFSLDTNGPAAETEPSRFKIFEGVASFLRRAAERDAIVLLL